MLAIVLSRRAMFPTGLLQVVFVITIVNAHLAVINFKDAVSALAHKKTLTLCIQQATISHD